MKKIIALIAILGLLPTSNIMSMDKPERKTKDFTTRLADIFNSPSIENVGTILDEINALERGKIDLNALQKHKRLAVLYQELADKPQKSASHKSFEDKAKQNLQQVLAIEEHMAAMETEVEKSLSDTTLPALPAVQRYSHAVSIYEQLVDLSQGCSYIKHANHLMQLRKYQKLKLREEIHNQVRELQEANNKKGLRIAYQSLMKTYTDTDAPQVKIIQDQLTRLEKSIAQENCDEGIRGLRDSLAKAGSAFYANEAARKINLANLSLVLADIYKEDERYTQEYATEMRRAKNIALQAAAFEEYGEYKETLNKRLQ